jgi:D-glycero-D-manno-heptose 1,7-bisphosphate phosphatase
VPGALFLDRDGVLNVKAPEGAYVADHAGFRLLPGVPEALATLRATLPGLRIVVVTNQRGIARGLVRAVTVDAIHGTMRAQLAATGGDVDAVMVCPHDLDACDCRKPRPGLLRQALARFPDIDLAASAMVGDSLADLEAGCSVGAHAYLVGEPERRARVRQAALERGVAIAAEADSLPQLLAAGALLDRLRMSAPALAGSVG